VFKSLSTFFFGLVAPASGMQVWDSGGKSPETKRPHSRACQFFLNKYDYGVGPKLTNKNRMKEIINEIETKLKGVLPGQAAQMKMSHVLRSSFNPAPADALKAGVLVLLYPEDGQWHVALTQRASKYGNDKHKGQMSFPGGKMDATDADLTETATRETEEEIGVDRRLIKVLGQLTNLYIPVSNFLVQPVVGFVEKTPEFVLEENEVAELVSSSLKELCTDEIRKIKDLSISKQMTLKNVPYFDIRGKVVWGATAMILNEFVTLLKHKNAV